MCRTLQSHLMYLTLLTVTLLPTGLKSEVYSFHFKLIRQNFFLYGHPSTVQTVEFKPPSCDYGYTLSAPATVTCNEQGTWSGPSPHCDIVNCTDPGTVVHGIMIGGQVRKTPYFTPYLTPYLTPYFTPYFTPYLHTISRSMLLYTVFYAAFYTVFTRYFLPYFPPYFPLYFRSILCSISCSILCPISCSIFCSVTHFFLTLFTQPSGPVPLPDHSLNIL